MSAELSNRDISEHYRDCKFWLFPSDLLASFAYWVVKQNPNKKFIVEKPLEAFSKYIEQYFPNPQIPTGVNYDELDKIIDDKIFESIPEILFLNQMQPDFIDLGALARNVFYGIVREQITSGYFERNTIKQPL